jgi:plasmid stability protein
VASIVIRQLDDKIKEKLRLRASRRGRSMEQEAREILRAALSAKPEKRMNLANAIRRHVEPLGGIELTIPRRGPLPKPVDFSQ